MMTIHRMMLKTHPLLTTDGSLRPFDLIQERFANDEAPPKGATPHTTAIRLHQLLNEVAGSKRNPGPRAQLSSKYSSPMSLGPSQVRPWCVASEKKALKSLMLDFATLTVAVRSTRGSG